MQNKKVKKLSFGFLSRSGSGLITGASDDDPSGIATYSQAGAQFGFATLWTALITFPLMVAIQEMCARIGVITGEGLVSNIKKHYSRAILYFVLFFCIPAIILNIGADIAGMGAVTHLLFPRVPAYIFSILFTLILTVAIVFLSYQKIAAVLKYLCLSLLLYLVIPFLVKPNLFEVLKSTFIPTIHLNKEFISILVAILGTTISPYLFFWQATMVAEDRKHQIKKIIVNIRMINEVKFDIQIGMLFSNLIMYFIILTTGATLFNAGIHQIDTVEQAAKALEPLAGRFAYLLFALGVIGTGFLAIPVLTGCLSYTLSAAFNWQGSLDKKYHQAKAFYGTIFISLLLGLSINFIGISAIDALIYTAIFYGITAPILILIVLHMANNEKIMGKFVNKRLSNLLGFITFFFMLLAIIILVYFQFA
ncbi:NRAMP family divalent metal transporter [Legionella sp. CNM-1927-20]|uniref:NRAMP family divalent metal transporter n=1 Tax=Legionella sp. CNM-1927-20 TaxID=3422221 RepID=UPI00403AA2BB